MHTGHMSSCIDRIEECAFVCARVAGMVVVVVLELVGELRCHISSSRSSPESETSGTKCG